MYYFGKSGQMPRGTTSGSLQAVVMDETFDTTDTAGYLATANSIRAFWTTRTGMKGTMGDVVMAEGTPVAVAAKIQRWRVGEITLSLVMEQISQHQLLIRSVVQRYDVRIPELGES
ncbi:MAG TPA: hypothetical protein VFJ16_26490 [Longimicrobium sp.]|nr:hypothetical protein [Longimicrobium sp.]